MQEKNSLIADRVPLELPIEVMETDIEGRQFVERTRTLVVSRHGAVILSKRKLAPEQELVIRHMGTNRETEVRVVGEVARRSGDFVYGVLLLDLGADFWGMDFPSPAEYEKEATRLSLWCSGCEKRETVTLNEIEFEVFAANQKIAHYCKRCGGLTLWDRGSHDGLGLPLLPRAYSSNQRREVRAKVSLKACVRLHHFDEEVVACENISRGGLCFKSRKRYPKGGKVEVAVPYAPRGTNSFVPGRLVHCQELGEKGIFRYGVAYLKVHRRASKI